MAYDSIMIAVFACFCCKKEIIEIVEGEVIEGERRMCSDCETKAFQMVFPRTRKDQSYCCVLREQLCKFCIKNAKRPFDFLTGFRATSMKSTGTRCLSDTEKSSW